MLRFSGNTISLALAAILAITITTLPFTELAQAAGRGGGGGGHGGGGGGHGGGGFHGGGGGFHGGGGGFHGGGGGFHGGGMRMGGFHGGGGHGGGGFHAARGGGGGRHGFAGHAPSGGHGFAGRGGPNRSHAPAGVAAGNHAGPNNHAVSNRVTQRNARAVGNALSSRQIRNAMHAPGGLHNPARRAAITAAVAGAAFAHHHGGLWWRHAHGGFGWVGPVFWPYAYDDFYDYAWWGGDADPFWDYGYGDLYAGLFSPYDYNSLSGYASYLPGSTGSTGEARPSKSADSATTLADMCGNDSKNIAGFPVEQFRGAISPNDQQAAALDDLANASQKASEDIRNSCPKDVAVTAPSRLAAMQVRVEAMRNAVSTVKPALDKFYDLLNDDQKAKITALAAEKPAAQRGGNTTSVGSCSTAQSTAPANAPANPWPSEQIDRDVKPTDAQRASLTALQDATVKAADILKSSCPPEAARTPPARLDAAAARLDAMLQAIGTVRPKLDDFYNSLSDEQKAAFDAVGPARNGQQTASADDDSSPPRHSHRRHHGVSVRGMVFRMMGL